jgi:hypothetical protein
MRSINNGGLDCVVIGYNEIPYLIGRGIYLSKFNDFMVLANKLLSLDIADAPERQNSAMGQERLQSMINIAAEWR